MAFAVSLDQRIKRNGRGGAIALGILFEILANVLVYRARVVCVCVWFLEQTFNCEVRELLALADYEYQGKVKCSRSKSDHTKQVARAGVKQGPWL